MPDQDDQQTTGRRLSVRRLVAVVVAIAIVWFLYQLAGSVDVISPWIQRAKEIYQHVAGLINSGLNIDWGDKLATVVAVGAPVLLLVAFLFDDTPRR